jgi:hypothetical protein
VEALVLSLGRDRFDPQPTEQDFYGSKPEMFDRIEMIGIDFQPNEPSPSSGLVSQGRTVPRWIDAQNRPAGGSHRLGRRNLPAALNLNPCLRLPALNAAGIG